MTGVAQPHFPETGQASPESPAWLAAYQPYVDGLVSTEAAPEFMASLPEIIGHIPSGERTDFTDFRADTHFESLEFDAHALDEAFALFPDTLRTIARDAAAVTAGRAAMTKIQIVNKHTVAGQAPRYSAFHTDQGVADPAQAAQPFYLVSSTQPTEFAVGPARFERPAIGFMQYDARSEYEETVALAPPEFAIVRAGIATVHASPIFTQDARRTFMFVQTKLQ